MGIYRVVEITCEISTGISLCTKKWHIIPIKWYDVSEEKHANKNKLHNTSINLQCWHAQIDDRYMVSVYRV